MPTKDDWYGKTAVYTSVVGDYDYLGQHLFQDGVDYLFYTDGKSQPLQSEWKVKMLPDIYHLHPRRVAKLPKTNPHFFSDLSSYKYTIWIDGGMEIISENFVTQLLSYLGDGLLLSPHFDMRDCAYGEATIRPAKYASEPMDEQVNFYRADGFPTNQGLYEGGIIARDMDNNRVRELGQMWYIHNLIFSYQDQISLPYCLWKMNYKPSVLPKSFRDFEFVRVNGHKTEL